MGHQRLMWLASLWLACTPRVAGPPLGPHENEAPIPVPYPPPAARPEELSDPPSETAVWVDGSYSWVGARYQWDEGGWFEPTPGCGVSPQNPCSYYAPPLLVRRRNGDLLYYPGHWHLDSGPADR